MKPAPFDYHAPRTLDEALALLTELDDVKVLAGGQSLIPLLNMRLAVFDHLVDLRHLDELRGIERRDDMLWIGASTTQAAIEHDADVASLVPLLARAMPHIGHFQIRNRGTLGGSIAHADPASELPAIALALDAQIEAVGSAGRRVIPAADFFTGTWTTALDDGEILSSVGFPLWEGRCGFAVDEFARRHGDFAIAGAGVAIELDPAASTVSRSAIGLFGLGATPERAASAEQMVVGKSPAEIDPAEVGRAAVAELDSVPGDLHGPADYRRRVGATIVARAWANALEEATHS